MSANLTDQVRQLEEKIHAAMDAAKILREEKRLLSQEVEVLRRKLGETQGREHEMQALRAQVSTLSQERQALLAEREDVRHRIDGMLASLTEIEVVAARQV